MGRRGRAVAGGGWVDRVESTRTSTARTILRKNTNGRKKRVKQESQMGRGDKTKTGVDSGEVT